VDVSAYEPAGHDGNTVHEVAPAREKEPEGQHMDEPEIETRPVGHGVHAVVPVTAVYVFTGHGVHELAFVPDEYVPMGHNEHCNDCLYVYPCPVNTGVDTKV